MGTSDDSLELQFKSKVSFSNIRFRDLVSGLFVMDNITLWMTDCVIDIDDCSIRVNAMAKLDLFGVEIMVAEEECVGGIDFFPDSALSAGCEGTACIELHSQEAETISLRLVGNEFRNI